MSRRFAFHGVDHKVGTTMIAQSVAEMIADSKKDIKVLLASLNGRPGTEYIDRIGESIEGLKIYLDNKVLSKKELMRSCRRSDNLYQLGGVASIGQSRHYFPETSRYLLDCVNEEFDIIIVDTGNDLDQGLTVGALECISNKFCILTQQESMLSRYERLTGIYHQLGISFSSFIINKYIERDPYDLNYISERMGISSESLIKIESAEYSRQAEMEYRSLLNYKNEIFSGDITCLVNIILKDCDLKPIEKNRKSLWKAFI